MVKWRKFGTTGTLPRAGHTAKLGDWARRTLVKEMTENPMDTLTDLQNSTSTEMGEPSGRTTISEMADPTTTQSTQSRQC